MKVSTAIYLDKRREKLDKTYPLKLRVSYQNQRRYYSIGIDITEDDWKKVNSTSPNSELKKIRTKTTNMIDEVDKLIKDIGDFSFSRFETLYLKKEKKGIRVVDAFDNYIMQLDKEGRASTSQSHTNAKRSLLEYQPNLQFVEVTPAFLNGYEKWMLGRKRTLSTIGIYLRALRTIINVAIEDGLMKKEMYPFG